MRSLRLALILFAVYDCFPGPVSSQEDYGYRLGTPVAQGHAYRPTGVPIYANALDPTVHRWYLPQIFFQEYGRRQWEYTNYAARRFYRPVSPTLQGDDFYDFYGDNITRGWLIYDWRQSQPRIAESSTVTQSRRYVDWFDRLVISSDRKGDFALSFMVGDEIATTLTPMTFRKAGFNGVVTSLSTSRLRATGVFSRISDPVFLGSARLQQMTNLGADAWKPTSPMRSPSASRFSAVTTIAAIWTASRRIPSRASSRHSRQRCARTSSFSS